MAPRHIGLLRLRRWLSGWMIVGGGFLLAGCGSSLRPSLGSDPLVGGSPTGSATAAAPTPSRPWPSRPLPDRPTPAAAPAALATGLPKPLPGSSELTLNPGSPARAAAPVTPPPNAAPQWTAPSGETGGVRLQPPVLPPAPSSPNDTNPGTALRPVSYSSPLGSAESASTRLTTFEEAQTYLRSKNVREQRLETWGENGEWRFSCSIPDGKNAFINHRYVQRAESPLKAIQGVIEQMDRDKP